MLFIADITMSASWINGLFLQAVLMDGTVQGVTAAVTVYTTLHVIMSLENVPAMQVGRESNVTNVSGRVCMIPSL